MTARPASPSDRRQALVADSPITESMIHERIDCGVCEPECPAQAIFPDADFRATPQWLQLNAELSKLWPNLTHKGVPPEDADAWNGKSGKTNLLSRQPHSGD